jgi:hypothetical protein
MVNWIAADVLRIRDGILVEHWDVIQDEAIEEQSKSKNPNVWWHISNVWISTQLMELGLISSDKRASSHQPIAGGKPTLRY